MMLQSRDWIVMVLSAGFNYWDVPVNLLLCGESFRWSGEGGYSRSWLCSCQAMDIRAAWSRSSLMSTGVE